ncbi:LacI family DNA-binding transcriptional regulator [Lentisphaera marina]|uniref:LacI family DNA-binding transcriptional regulator n=1 Tax=Lentisphaera marina TaxID=1111041 RepID=UPI002365EB22|nr:LacI family DNA-binding transcriptional regulator [Lentisphaera marina]MDD7986275.1 LacI family DNA-binding transcriptional regulator [Lentisphaera marina]
MNQRVSLQDVAKVAGVSAMTVSRVINNHPRVLAKTSEKVQKVIKELGYTAVPSLRKRGRRSRAHTGIHTGQIALVLLGMEESFANNPVIGKTLHGIRSHLSANDISTVLVPVQDQKKIPDILDRRSIDGMIVTGEFPKDSFKEYFADMPIVYVYCLSNEIEMSYDQIMPNNKKVAGLASENFLKQGVKHCAFFDPSPNHPEFNIRGQEFIKFFEKSGGKVDMYLDKDLSDAPESAEQDVDRSKFKKMIDRFLSNKDRARAIFLPSDSVTAIFHRELRQKGEDPSEYQIISCNQERPYLEGLYPMPESIDIQSKQIGIKAAERLLLRLSDSALQTEKILVDPKL